MKKSNEPFVPAFYLDRQRLGVFGEEQAAAEYRRLGYIILAANYRCPFGELDLIALRSQLLAFIEVRIRDIRSPITPAQTVDAAKQRRLTATARHFLAAVPEWSQSDMRFDVCEVFYEGEYRYRLNRIENAFTL